MAEFDWAQAGDLQRADLNAPPQPGFQIRHQHRFTAADISAFATMIGDMNPTHHDAAAAAGAGLSFGQVIATGGHMVSVMMGALSTGMDKLWPNIGLDFSSRFRRAIRAGETTEVIWTVVKVEHQTKLRGLVVSYEGTLTNSAGETALMAQCDVLIPDGKYLA